jgi:leucyl/phenylalanyl-tRNA--protein transferase
VTGVEESSGTTGLVGWGVALVALFLGRRPGTRLLRRPVGTLQLRYLDWPLQRLALAVLTRRRDQGWWDGVPADLAPADHPAFFGGRDGATAALGAYRAGLYPMPEPSPAGARLRRLALDVRGLPWHCPEPRSVTPVGERRVNRNLRRGVRGTAWHTTMDAAFDRVLEHCSRPDSDNFWLTARHRRTWRELHRRGHAHSLEVWDGETLVGGLFGIQTGGVFNVASLFHLVPHASQVADVDLHERLQRAGGTLVDAGGFWYDRSASAGVRRVPRREFLDVLRCVRDDDVRLDTGRLPADRLFA